MIIGRYSWKGYDIIVNIPKIRKIGRKVYPYRAKYLGSHEHPLCIYETERDLSQTLGFQVNLMPTSTRGGNVVTRKQHPLMKGEP